MYPAPIPNPINAPTKKATAIAVKVAFSLSIAPLQPTSVRAGESSTTNPRALKTNDLVRDSGREESSQERLKHLDHTRLSPKPPTHPGNTKPRVRGGESPPHDPASTQNNKLVKRGASGREESSRERPPLHAACEVTTVGAVST
jgi:hypothetical protein